MMSFKAGAVEHWDENIHYIIIAYFSLTSRHVSREIGKNSNKRTHGRPKLKSTLAQNQVNQLKPVTSVLDEKKGEIKWAK